MATRMATRPTARSTARRPPGRWSRWAFRAGVLFVGLLVVYMAVTFVQVWTASRSDEARASGAIIVLGAAQYDGEPSPVFAARLDHAADLYDQGLAEIVVVTGGRQEGDRFTEANSGYRYLLDRGIPDEALRLEVDGTNTWESLVASAHFLADEGVDEVLLVSDPYHSYRIAATAGELGLDAHVSPAATSSSVISLLRETAVVSVGRIIGYGRLVRIEGVGG